MVSPISVNAHLAYIHNYPLFIERMKRLNPAVLLAYVDSDNDIKMIQALPAQLPETTIIARVYHDDEGAFHLPGSKGEPMISTPADYLNKYGYLGKNGMYLNVMNEPGSAGDISTLINWHLEAIAKADKDNTAIAPFAWGVGHPQVINGEWDSQLDPVLRAMAKRPDLFLMNVHEYLPEQIPNRVGRLYAYVKRCMTLGIRPNRMVITEAGFDTAGGVENGYKSRGVSGDDFARILINLCEGVYKPLLDDGLLLGLCVFSYGNSGKWDAFDVQGDDGFFKYLLDHPIHIPKQQPPTAPPPPVVTPPAHRWIATVARLKEGAKAVNLREQPNVVSNDLGDVTAGATIEYNIDAIPQSGGWWHVRYKGSVGYVSDRYFEPAVVQSPSPPPDDPVPVPLPADYTPQIVELESIADNLKSEIDDMDEDIELQALTLERLKRERNAKADDHQRLVNVITTLKAA